MTEEEKRDWAEKVVAALGEGQLLSVPFRERKTLTSLEAHVARIEREREQGQEERDG